MANLDETGLEVAGCRHGIAQKAVNMFRGEIFGYPHYLHTRFFMNVVCFWADVVCQYWPWARQKEAVTGIPLTSVPCLSVMHANAHSWLCQVLWGGRWQNQAAASTGEDMEQLFSFMSRFNMTTKNMSAAGREEHLTAAALFWNSRKVDGLAMSLCKRLSNIQKQKTELSTQLLEVSKLASIEEAKELGCISRQKVQECARNELMDTSNNFADLAEYFRLRKYICDAERLQMYISSTSESLSIITGFHDLYVAATSILNDLSQKKARLISLERKVDELHLEDLEEESLRSAASATLNKLQEQLEMGYLLLQRKHSTIQTRATSSKQRSSLRRAITNEKAKLKKHIQQYNSIVRDMEMELPSLQEDDIFDGKFPWSPLSTHHSICMREAYEAANIYNKLIRTEEEEVLLVKEMSSYILYYNQKILPSLSSQVQELDDRLGVHPRGSMLTVTHSMETPQPAILTYRRASHTAHESVLLGERATLMSGFHKAQSTLARGADLFRPFLEPGATVSGNESIENDADDYSTCSIEDSTYDSYSDVDVD
jgi:hypothetical protein